MTQANQSAALYYPFHLCHAHCLTTMLQQFESVHFRDYMALQLTPMTGTTAYHDRMGDQWPDLVASGRIVQGHSVSGPLPEAVALLVNRDLGDPSWRSQFHEALCTDRRFQRGLFNMAHAMNIGGQLIPGPAALLALMKPQHREAAYSLQAVTQIPLRRSTEEAYRYEYGLALIQTSAALIYTIRLAASFALTAVTDSSPHFALLEMTQAREGSALPNLLIPREGY